MSSEGAVCFDQEFDLSVLTTGKWLRIARFPTSVFSYESYISRFSREQLLPQSPNLPFQYRIFDAECEADYAIPTMRYAWPQHNRPVHRKSEVWLLTLLIAAGSSPEDPPESTRRMHIVEPGVWRRRFSWIFAYKFGWGEALQVALQGPLEDILTLTSQVG